MKTNLKKTIAFVSSLAMLASGCVFNTFAASAYETTNENSFIHTKDFEKYRDEITQEEDDKSQDDNIESTTLTLKEFTDSVGRTYNVYDYDEKHKNSTHHLHSLQTGLLYLEITLEPNITVTQEMLDEIEAAMPSEEMGYDFYEEIYYQPKKGTLYENYRFSGTGRFIKGEEPVRQYYDGDDLEPENELAHTLIITPHVLKYASDYLREPENNLQGIKTPDLSYVTIPDVEGPMVCSTSSDYDGVSHTVSNSNLIALGREDLIYSGQLYDVVKYEDTVKKLCELDFVCDENQGRLYNLNGVEEFKPYYGQGWYNAVQYAEIDGINLSTTSINGSGSPYRKYLEQHESDKTKPIKREELNYKLNFDNQTLYVDYDKTTGGKPLTVVTKKIDGSIPTVGEKKIRGFWNNIKNFNIADGIETVTGLDNLKYLEKLFVPDSVTYITADLPVDKSSLTIVANKGTYAESFATENGVNFIDAKEYSKTTALDSVKLNDATEPTQSTEETVFEISKLGDLNFDGNVNIADAVILNKYLVESASLSEEAKKNADCDKDGKITSSDSLVILNYIVGSIDEIK